MIRHLLLAAGACAGLLAATSAQATTFNSFNVVDSITGVTVSPTLGSPNTSYTVTLNPGAFFTLSSTNYSISDIIGFYLLAPGYNDPSLPALTAVAGFSDDSDAHSFGSISGWVSNPNNGITSGNSLTFTFPSIDFTHYTQLGFHVRLANQTFPGTSGNTGNITGALVPAPSAMALLGASGLFTMRRRRR